MDRVGVVVLTGGGGARLGGADKAGLEVAGRTLLERALATAGSVGPVVVVGDPVPGVETVREDPPGGGPAAGLLAGLLALPPVERVVALAVDMPFVTPATLARLLAAVGEHDGALLVDRAGRRQLLCAAYDVAALLAAAPADRDGLPVRRLLAPLDLVEVPAVGHEAHDVDTPADLAAAEAWLGGEGCEPGWTSR